MNVMFAERVIELTKSEMSDAKVYGSEMYNMVMAARRDNPGFEIRLAKVKRTKSDFNNLKLKDIADYVEKHGTDEQKTHFAIISKRTIGDDGEYCEPQPFFLIKKWFLESFPELKDERKAYRERVQKIYDQAAEAAA